VEGLLVLLLFLILWLVDRMLHAAVHWSRSRAELAKAVRRENAAVRLRLAGAPEAQPSTKQQDEPCPAPDS
jgi:hypothetical protein